jgi:hypothetical protein
VLALTLGQAKTIGILVVVVLVALAVLSAWVMKTVAQKAALAAILVLLALLVWTQRSSLDECAGKVRAGGAQVDTTCSFFGSDIKISTQRSS